MLALPSYTLLLSVCTYETLCRSPVVLSSACTILAIFTSSVQRVTQNTHLTGSGSSSNASDLQFKYALFTSRKAHRPFRHWRYLRLYSVLAVKYLDVTLRVHYGTTAFFHVLSSSWFTLNQLFNAIYSEFVTFYINYK
jgi:hypothetical protein